MKEFQHNLRLDAGHVEELREVAHLLGLDKNSTLRFLVREKLRELRRDSPPPAPPVAVVKKRRPSAA
jgi:hypothetical protein